MSGSRVYEASGAGRWFPADAVELQEKVEGFIEQADVPSRPGRIMGGITPHAGYDWSGAVAGHTFRALQDQARDGRCPDAVVVLGFSHRSRVAGASVLDADAVQTPLGQAPLAVSLARQLVDASPHIHFDSGGHHDEHSVENAIPFLQVALPGVPIVPILLEQPDSPGLMAMTEALRTDCGDGRIALIASTDLLHDADYDRVCVSDRDTLERMIALDLEGLQDAWSPMHQVCCGIGPVSVLMQTALSCGVGCGHALAYRNSGDLDPASRGQWVVGYGSVVFAPGD